MQGMNPYEAPDADIDPIAPERRRLMDRLRLPSFAIGLTTLLLGPSFIAIGLLAIGHDTYYHGRSALLGGVRSSPAEMLARSYSISLLVILYGVWQLVIAKGAIDLRYLRSFNSARRAIYMALVPQPLTPLIGAFAVWAWWVTREPEARMLFDR